ncbi:MAG TPA: YdeI/OmpD-associated family protein [Candidatus Polarisedimenticolia bacterium]|jgi:uncharacterized protein YdeI (YjbR/CyaY-like superfamily)|nr:YdeI/OmpD-associated family protein [Candidatus Polarisedimenticolia bacterium]
MGKKDPRVDAYIDKAAPFARPILKHLRKAVHAAVPEVTETIKWGFPHFDYDGIFCSMAAFKEHCAFGFWQHALLQKKIGLGGEAAKQAMGSFGRIASKDDLPEDARLRRILTEAKALRDSGEKTPRTKRARPAIEPPDFFLAALRKNAKARAAFESFPPSHRREYLEWIIEAKGEETRQRRLETALAWMAEGKSRNWKYAR